MRLAEVQALWRSALPHRSDMLRSASRAGRRTLRTRASQYWYMVVISFRGLIGALAFPLECHLAEVAGTPRRAQSITTCSEHPL